MAQRAQNLNQFVRRNATVSHKRERGATLFEYAMVFMIFLALVFGISGFGHALFVYHHLDHVTKEATRYASVRGFTCGDDSSCVASNSASGTAGPTTTTDVTTFIDSITPQSIDYTKFAITTCGVGGTGASMCAGSTTMSNAGNCDPGSGGKLNNPGCIVTITIQYPYTFVFPVFGAAGSINLSSTSQLIILH